MTDTLIVVQSLPAQTIEVSTQAPSTGGASGAIAATTLSASGAVSGAGFSGFAAKSDTHYIGTTAVALNRASGALALTGVSIDGTAAGNVTPTTLNNGTLPVSATTLSATTTGKVGTTLAVGGATPSASGVGITFPAVQSVSSDANTLDDYEEGTWTPILNFGGGSTGITYAAQVGEYTKVGRSVTFKCQITLTSKGSSMGNASVAGLPFGSVGNLTTGSTRIEGMAVGLVQPIQILIGVTSVSFRFEKIVSGSFAILTDADFSGTCVLFVNGTYFA